MLLCLISKSMNMLQSGSEIIENISWRQDSDNTVMAPMAVPSSGSVPLGVPVSNHEYDLTDADTFNKKGFYSIGANPPPAWSQREYSAGSLETGIQLFIRIRMQNRGSKNPQPSTLSLHSAILP